MFKGKESNGKLTLNLQEEPQNTFLLLPKGLGGGNLGWLYFENNNKKIDLFPCYIEHIL